MKTSKIVSPLFHIAYIKPQTQSRCVHCLYYANEFFIECLKTVASNETTTISQCKAQPQIHPYEHPFSIYWKQWNRSYCS